MHIRHHITRICVPFCTSSSFSRFRDIATSCFNIQWFYYDIIELKDINCVWAINVRKVCLMFWVVKDMC